jgi:serine/threonine-protein kinase
MGKVGYLAPEQLAHAGAADRRWDVWSMGVVLWEVLCARRLFSGKSLGSPTREIAEMPIPHPSVYNCDVSPALDTVVMRALERDPQKRYATARELGLALERVLAEAGDSVPAAHLADWLEDLFPGRSIEKRGIRAMAQSMGTALGSSSIGPRGSSAAPAALPSVNFLDEDSSSGTDPITEIEVPVAVSISPARKAKSSRSRGLGRAQMWRRLAFAAAWLALFALSFYAAIQLGSFSLGLIEGTGTHEGAVASAQ